MSLRQNLREWFPPIYFLGQNPTTLTGAVLTTSGALTMIAFWFYDFFLPGPPHPYAGILIFLILPGIFLFGLMLIPLGIWLRRRRIQAEGGMPATLPRVDLHAPMMRRGLAYVGIATGLNFAILGTASYRGVEYMDSTSFCGTACHSVMAPEYAAYQNSPHARVGCVECHIGPGAPWFVRSKLSGLRQVFAVTFKTYSRPIPSPVKYLRPARETCEHCHWPQRFTGDRLVVRTAYKDDEKNTPQINVILLKIGGQNRQGVAGIHGHHLSDGGRIRFISSDAQRQVIPAVYYTDDSGKTTEFLSSDVKPTHEQLEKGEQRVMDCIDCHNRPTHAFDLPERALDRQMAAGAISVELPYIKKKAVELLKAQYPSQNEAQQRIAEEINNFYRSNYAEVYATRRTIVQQAAEEVTAIYLRNVFPEMRLSWGAHPNNLGHNDFPGCFRCHDGSHTSADGQTISNDCSACHQVLAVDEENPKILSDLGMK